MSLLFGLLGRSLGHSLSPAMFAAVFSQIRPGAAYVPWEVEPADLPAKLAALRELSAGGFNVTIPYKETLIPYLDAVEGDAAALGAVNCVVARGARFVGLNTDAVALEASLAEALRQARLPGFCPTALVLGAGGAAKAAVLALERFGARAITVAARRSEAVFDNPFFADRTSRIPFEPAVVEAAADLSDIVVNATPVGMFPDMAHSPLSGGFHRHQVVYDLIYNPRPTLFLRQAADAGAMTLDGLDMLARQAAASLRIWTGANVSHQKFLAAARAEEVRAASSRRR